MYVLSFKTHTFIVYFLKVYIFSLTYDFIHLNHNINKQIICVCVHIYIAHLLQKNQNHGLKAHNKEKPKMEKKKLKTK